MHQLTPNNRPSSPTPLTAKLLDIGLTQAQHPGVDTFHSFAFKIMHRAVEAGIMPQPKELWTADDCEMGHIRANRAI
jgi:superfamily I DNA/RNA helicase